jgi:lipopolysaccharide/colanic/teichoic acid biosynthesis glycosyltransferase
VVPICQVIALRPARGSRRSAGHQYQRRPAPGLQRDRQTDRHRDPSVALVTLMIPFWIIAALIKMSSRGEVFPRMGDGKPFMIYKFRRWMTTPKRPPCGIRGGRRSADAAPLN